MKQLLTGKWKSAAVSHPAPEEDARPKRPGLLVFENEALAAVVPLGPAPASVGRDPGCVIQPTSGEVSRIHCSIQLVDAAVVVTDLGSTNGTYRFGQRIRREVLRVGDEIAVGRALIKLVDLDRRAWAVHTGLYDELYVDGLTRLPNRRGFRAKLDERLPALRPGTPVGLLLILIDGIDRIGHDAGIAAQSAAVFHAARRLGSLVPAGGVAARLGLGEFALFCSGLPKERLFALREELHASSRLADAKEIPRIDLSFSVGVADARLPLRSIGALFCAAEDSLFHACARARRRLGPGA